MPVVTRAQARKASGSDDELVDLTSNLSIGAVKHQLSSAEAGTAILASKSLNAFATPMVKPATATKAPMSHPLIINDESPSSVSASECNEPIGSTFTIPAVQPPPTPLAPESGATLQPPIQETLPKPVTLPVRAYMPPEEKLLKPLPDKPVDCTKLPDGPEPTVIEIEYPDTEDLVPVEGDPAVVLTDSLSGMNSPEWVDGCAALVMMRRLARHHAAVCAPAFPDALPAIVKAIRSLRSALSKTAIMTARDLFLCDAPAMLPICNTGSVAQPVNSLLAQLLLKAASNDKKFVIEEAQKALITMTETLDPSQFLTLLLPYTEHKNPKVRGKAANVAAACVHRMNNTHLTAYGLDVVLKLAARLISDNTPEARDAAKKLGIAVKICLDDQETVEQLGLEIHAPDVVEEGEEQPPPLTMWEYYCQSTLGASKAVAVLKI